MTSPQGVQDRDMCAPVMEPERKVRLTEMLRFGGPPGGGASVNATLRAVARSARAAGEGAAPPADAGPVRMRAAALSGL